MNRAFLWIVMFSCVSLINCSKEEEEEQIFISKPAYEADTAIVRAILDSNGCADISARAVTSNNEDDSRVAQLILTKDRIGSRRIHTLLNTIGQLAYLQLIQAPNGDIDEIPESIGNLKKLTSLYLQDNKISEIPAQLGLCSSLKNVNLGNNNISTLSAGIGTLTNLISLQLDSNVIGVIPNNISGCAKLVSLEIRNNLLTTLPASLFTVTSLSNLSVEGNKICNPDSSLQKLMASKYMDLGTQICP